MLNLNEDIIKIIISYLGCLQFKNNDIQTKLFILNKDFNIKLKTLVCCKIKKYKKLIVCTSHQKPQDYNITYVINKLNEATYYKKKFGFVGKIEFKNENQIRLANPYLYQLGSIIERDNKGLSIYYDWPLHF